MYKAKLHHVVVLPNRATQHQMLDRAKEFGSDKDLSNDEHYQNTLDAAHTYDKEEFDGKYEIWHIDQRRQKIPLGSVPKSRRV